MSTLNSYKDISPRMSEEELTKRLMTSVIGIVVLIVIMILSLFVFAPKVGWLLSFISKHKNEEEYRPTAKISPPIFNDLPEAVKDTTVEIKGFTQAGATVKLYVNGPEKATTIAGDDGIFTFTNVTLIKGTNTIFAKAVDANNNESEKSQNYTIVVDQKSPDLELTNIKDGDTVKNLDKRIKIEGKTDEEATIKINDRLAVQKSDFTFEFLLGVDEGNVKIKIEATDKAGNTKTEEITVKYEKKSS